MLSRRCQICNIRSREKGETKRLFMAKFPLDPVRCKEWVKATGNEDLAYIPIEKLHELKYVCENHFEPKDFGKHRARLSHTAIPSVNISSKPLSDEVLKDFPLHMSSDRVLEVHRKRAFLKYLETLPIRHREHDYCSTYTYSNFQTTSDLAPAIKIKKNPSKKTYNRLQHAPRNDIDNNNGPTNDVDDNNASTDYFDDNNAPTNYFDENFVNSGSKPSTSTSDPKPMKITQNNSTSNRSCGTPDVFTAAHGQSSHQWSYKYVASLKGNEGQKGIGHKQWIREQASLEITPAIREKVMPPSKIRKLQKRLAIINNEVKILRKKDKLINSISSPILKSFIESSIANNNRKPGGKRWTELNKTVALAIYKRSPKVYKYISQLLSFPSEKTLRIALDHVKINTCVNNSDILKHMKKRVKNLPDNDKICVILFNKTPLKKRLIYNTVMDRIDGYEDLGFDQRSQKVADHALVTMLQGVHKNIKHPIAFYFYKETITIDTLASIIEKNVRAMIEIGYDVIATVCDHSAVNVAALNLLRTWSNSPEPNYFYVDGKKIFIIYDVPHLFKSLRNNFVQAGEIIIDNKKGNWEHLMLVERTNQASLRFQKITKLHVKPTFKSKKKLSHAVQILSNTVAAILKLLTVSIHHQDTSGEILQTADVIESLDQLFDCTNGPSCKSDIKLNRRENVRKNSFHHLLWLEYKRKLRTFKFPNLDDQYVLKTTRCINGYRITISSLQDIWRYMDSKNIERLNLRRLNMDALDKFFVLMKQFCPPFNNPTCNQFASAFRSSILTHLTETLNKEDDDDVKANKNLFYFQKLIFPKDGRPEKEVKSEEMLDIQKIFKDLDQQPIVYIGGYLASVLLKNESCQKCVHSIKISNPEMNTMYDCNALKDWWQNKPSLTYPTEALCRTVEKALNIFETTVQTNIYVKDILHTCKTEIRTKTDFLWVICENHRDIMMEKLLRRLSLLLFRNHCQMVNKVLMAEKQLTEHLLGNQNNVIVENECEMNEEPIAEFTVYMTPNDSENY